MTMSVPAYAPLALLAILLTVALVTDLRYRLIHNWTNIIVALLAPLYWLAQGEPLWPDALYHVLIALAVFLLFTIAFVMGVMGGGDLKLFAALALWFDLETTVSLIFLASLFGGLVTLVAALEHRLRRREGRTRVPYGVGISLAGLVVVGTTIF